MPPFTVPVLEAHGIRLRPFTAADTAPIVEAGRDPMIPWITTVEEYGDHAAALAFVERQGDRARNGTGYSFAIADADTDEAMGQIGVWPSFPQHRRWWIGYWLAPSFRGRSVMSRALTIATEFAFTAESAVRVELYIEPWNTASCCTAVSAGYRCEGLLRDNHIIDGEPRDMFVYARPVSVDLDGPASDPELIIRDCTDVDVAELLVLQRCCWVSEAIANDTLDIPPLREGPEDVSGWVREWTVLTVRDGPRLVGAVRGRLVGRTWEIGRLMVAPDLAGRGLGRRLLDQIERLAPAEADTYELFTGAQSRRNIGLYERAGYRIVEHEVPDGHIAGAVTLRKGKSDEKSALSDAARRIRPC